jgi:hypothetical protein
MKLLIPTSFFLLFCSFIGLCNTCVGQQHISLQRNGDYLTVKSPNVSQSKSKLKLEVDDSILAYNNFAIAM